MQIRPYLFTLWGQYEWFGVKLSGIVTGMSYLMSWNPRSPKIKHMLGVSVKNDFACKASRFSVNPWPPSLRAPQSQF